MLNRQRVGRACTRPGLVLDLQTESRASFNPTSWASLEFSAWPWRMCTRCARHSLVPSRLHGDEHVYGEWAEATLRTAQIYQVNT